MKQKILVRPDKKVFVGKFKKLIKDFTKKLDDYIKNPSEDNIHDIRIAIRRLEAAHRILPKGQRRQTNLQRYIKQAKILFKINTQIRDFDIIRAKLERDNEVQFVSIIESISSKRRLQQTAGHRLALKLKEISPPGLKEGDIRNSKLRKRFKKIVSGLIIEINRNIPIVLNDDKRVDEIHKLRKDFKKIRYSIELIADSTADLKSIKKLKNIQDELGLIHDSDIFLDYLKGVEGPHELSEIIREEIVERRKMYQKFVQVFKSEKSYIEKLIL